MHCEKNWDENRFWIPPTPCRGYDEACTSSMTKKLKYESDWLARRSP